MPLLPPVGPSLKTESCLWRCSKKQTDGMFTTRAFTGKEGSCECNRPVSLTFTAVINRKAHLASKRTRYSNALDRTTFAMIAVAGIRSNSPFFDSLLILRRNMNSNVRQPTHKQSKSQARQICGLPNESAFFQPPQRPIWHGNFYR